MVNLGLGTYFVYKNWIYKDIFHLKNFFLFTYLSMLLYLKAINKIHSWKNLWTGVRLPFSSWLWFGYLLKMVLPFMHTCKFVYLHTCILAHLYTWILAYLHTCILVYSHTCILVYMHTCIHSYMHVFTYATVHTYVLAYMHTCTLA